RLNSFEKLKKMYALKTGELIKCAMLLGYYAYCDSPEDEVVKDLNEFALNIGIAFQIKDDILDKVSNSEELGKPIGSDEKNNKVTSLSFLSIQEAQNLVDELTKKAISIIKKYDVSSYGFYPLEELAKYLVERKK
ncbi:MAG: polyprenyl synthetase family protein, partial [Clostridia bacterium]|nr:polyprenyl synthetase family protein [Clostridia bacterium]